MDKKQNQEVLAIIPARGGSRGMQRKNLAPLYRKPLIQYTIDAAKESRLISRLILSSEDDEIVEYCRAKRIEVPFKRPRMLAQDSTPMIDVVKHAMGFLKKRENYKPRYIIVLQPTSPLRTSKHIDEAIKILSNSKADSVVSVVEVPHQYNPISVMKIKNKRLMPFLPGEGTRVLRRQGKPRVYARNGPAILVVRSSIVERGEDLYGKHLLPYVMGWPESIDIDTNADLRLAECWVEKRVCQI